MKANKNTMGFVKEFKKYINDIIHNNDHAESASNDLRDFIIQQELYIIHRNDKKDKKNKNTNNKYEDRIIRIEPTSRMKSQKNTFAMTESESMKADDDRNKRARQSNA